MIDMQRVGSLPGQRYITFGHFVFALLTYVEFSLYFVCLADWHLRANERLKHLGEPLIIDPKERLGIPNRYV